MRLLEKVIESIRQGDSPCFFHLATGAYCPGCGGTRAVLALLHGRILDSLRYHPLVLFLAVALPALFLYWLCCKWKRSKMRSSVWVAVLAAGCLILAGNFVIKNYYLLVMHVDLLG